MDLIFMILRHLVPLRIMGGVLSVSGYVLYLRKKMKVEFALSFTFATIGSLMFFAGILNIMLPVTVCIFLYGIVLFIINIKQLDFCKNDIFFLTFYFFSAVLIMAILYGCKFIHFDNFTHWGLSAKILIEKNRFPCWIDNNIEWQSYPVGSASFIFFFVKICGIKEEWFQLFIQALLILSMFSCLFVFANNWKHYLIAVCGVILLICGNTSISDILVDTLLPAVAVATVSFCIYYRKCSLQKWCFLIPYLIFLIAVKNSGIFFVLMIWLLFINISDAGRNVKIWLLSIPIVALLLWKAHVSLVFPDANMSNHAMTIEYFIAELKAKSIGQIGHIVFDFFDKVFSLSNSFLFVIFLTVFLLVVIENEYKKNEYSFLLFFVLISYLFYQLSCLGMYIFSMPEDQAVTLAGYDRYHRTIMVFIAGIMVISLMIIEFRGKSEFIKSGLIIACLLLVFFAVNPNFTMLKKQDYDKTERYQIEKMIKDIPENKSIAVLRNEGEGGEYQKYLLTYLLNPYVINSFKLDLAKDKLDFLYEHDYLIPISPNEKTMEFLSDEFGITSPQAIDLNSYIFSKK